MEYYATTKTQVKIEFIEENLMVGFEKKGCNVHRWYDFHCVKYACFGKC